MAPRMVYFAYPIDQAVDDVPAGYGQLTRLLEECKIPLLRNGVDIIFDPGDGFRVASDAKVGPEVAAVNQLALQHADAVLAMMPQGVPSVSVPMEIAWALEAGKPVACVSDLSTWMLGGIDVEHFQVFEPTAQGFGFAISWLLSQERPDRTADLRDPLPFVVLRKTEDGIDLTPIRKYAGDAGWDLTTAADTVVKPGEQVDVPCGIAVAVPDWAFGRITGRSSTLRNRGLLVNEGIIDGGFRGELFVNVRNMTDEPVAVLSGERIGQFIIHTNDSKTVQPVQVEALPPSDRGEAGFGSTGV